MTGREWLAKEGARRATNGKRARSIGAIVMGVGLFLIAYGAYDEGNGDSMKITATLEKEDYDNDVPKSWEK